MNVPARMEQVAGALPEITVAYIMAVGFTPAPEMGMWQYDFSDPEGPQLGTVAVPGGEQVFNMKEPVAIVCPNDDLNIQMPNDEKTEMNREFEFGKFFLWDTPSEGLVVRYFEGEPTPGFACVGRVGIVLAPFLPSMTPRPPRLRDTTHHLPAFASFQSRRTTTHTDEFVQTTRGRCLLYE
ncbi:conserved unknown protein [Ectocarpus siliculosus]|uniref:Uncharacterized protein n=1 Tax=Ectocarpus siliculosus TaxID=2880 RepID=D7G2G3_ECTSI|nr:conserved unknown protein [Ectocarpus siliculosus]|eukprot:CBJ33398.1 conserved unknown protein [Ectocarpus siliculosus]